MDKVSRKKDQIDRQAIDPMTRLSDFRHTYLRTYKQGSVSASWYRDLIYLSDKLVEGVGNKPIGKIRPIEVQEFLNECGCYSQSTVKKIYDITNQIFKYAVINGATSYQFNLEVPKGKMQECGKSLTDHEQDALVRVLEGHRGELFIKMMLYCGLRPSEVSALTWDDIDLDRQVVRITKAVKKDGSIGSTKSHAGRREVPLPYTFTNELKKAVRSDSGLFCGQSNGVHTKSSVRKMWMSVKRDLEKELGYEVPYRLYDIRHTYCTNLEAQGVPINIASRLMGHSDISLTSRIYTHATDASLEIARNCINCGKSSGK